MHIHACTTVHTHTYTYLCIYNRAIFRTQAHLEPKTSSKARRTCKMIRHVHNAGIINTVYSSKRENIFASLFSVHNTL